MRSLIALGLIFLSGVVDAAAIERFKAFAKGTQTARGSFEQKVYDRDRRLSQESKGSFAFQRPGKFRWVYDKPVDQVIVGDGDRVWIYDRGLAQVTVRKLARALGSTPAALLAGSTDVEKAFELAEAGAKDGIEWLEAKPKDREAGFERIRMGFNASGLQAMELTDNFGQTTILRFTALEPNAKVEAKEFRFEPPKGADVLGDK
ncbi:MAG: outer rane lipoprotein carrier protein [Betaproteobacteria bacterium]|jgi:outer membrane lipoprotein carrier protein|nr:outer rane lipoprotein carrier protein [Betaproteobacteria bacterium]